MQVIDAGGRQIAFVVDPSGKLLGAVTDGDVRRALLRGQSLDAPVSVAMNAFPVVKSPESKVSDLLAQVSERAVRQIPVVNRDHVIVSIEEADSLSKASIANNRVAVVMAGGVGSRLYPLTQDVPKPMLPVGGKPMLETIVSGFASQGFSKVYLSVNYKREVIESYFADGAKFGIAIDYLREDTKLGTAGALGLLPVVPDSSFVVMNCDVLTNVRFERLLDFHDKQRSVATMAVREYDIQVPYGVVKVDETSGIASIDEKPTQRFFVNAGIYVLQPGVLKHLQPQETLDMPDLFSRLNSAGVRTCAFPVCEYWIDVGQHQDLERAQGEYSKIFGRI